MSITASKNIFSLKKDPVHLFNFSSKFSYYVQLLLFNVQIIWDRVFDVVQNQQFKSTEECQTPGITAIN